MNCETPTARKRLSTWFGGATARRGSSGGGASSPRYALYDEVGEFLRAHRLEVSPLNFEIVRDHLTGERATRTAVDALLRTHGYITDAMLQGIAAARPGAALPGAVTEMASQLATRLSETLQILSASSASASDFGAALARESGQLDSDPLGAVSRLVELTRAVVESNREMVQRLDTNRREAEQLRANLERARHEAEHDHLTGLPNRRNIEGLLEAIASRTPASPVCVALCDIDDFKRVNDEHGHEAGDRVLKYFARLLKESLGNAAIVGRFGGEEFVCVFEASGLAEARAQLEAAREALVGRALVNQETRLAIGRLSFSAGLAPLHSDAPKALRNADGGLYRAKHSGKNCVVVHVD